MDYESRRLLCVGAGLALALLATRGGEPAFRYAPGPPLVQAGPEFRMKAAVRPFRDGTDPDFFIRYGPAAGYRGPERDFNLRVVPSSTWPRVNAERLAAAFAAELGGSGLFEAVRLADSEAADAPKEDVALGAVVRESTLHAADPERGAWRFSLEFAAYDLPAPIGVAGGTPFWTKTVSRTPERDGRRPMEQWNDVFRGMFAEALKDLERALKERAAAP